MPTRKVEGRDRIDLKADPGLVDLVDKAAQALGMNFSSYVRAAIVRQLMVDGFNPTAQHAQAPKGGKRGRSKRAT